MKKLLLVSLMALAIQTQAQNVGIGNPTPTEKLDVTGNINVTGTIKANGLDGTAGQVLMKNGTGILAWGDMCDYKNFKVFEYTNFNEIQTFIVPANITKLKIQAWGGGGKGNGISGSISMGGGGGGGGYIEGVGVVNPGSTINVVVGVAASTSITNSSVSYASNSIWSFFAYGGANSVYDAGLTRIDLGAGGTWGASNSSTYIGIQGESGKPTILRFDQITATEFGKSVTDGNGGNAGNTTASGGEGGYLFVNNTTFAVLSQAAGTNGKVPGGGAPSQSVSNSGGKGRVIIYW